MRSLQANYIASLIRLDERQARVGPGTARLRFVHGQDRGRLRRGGPPPRREEGGANSRAASSRRPSPVPGEGGVHESPRVRQPVAWPMSRWARHASPLVKSGRVCRRKRIRTRDRAARLIGRRRKRVPMPSGAHDGSRAVREGGLRAVVAPDLC